MTDRLQIGVIGLIATVALAFCVATMMQAGSRSVALPPVSIRS